MLYLIHLEPRYKHAGHYLGYTRGHWVDRVQRHVAGHGSPLIRAALAAGCKLSVTRVWRHGTRTDERRLKNGGGLSRHCPVCRASGTYHA